MMYLEFTTKNLNEYNKIIDILVSCQTPTHFDSVKTLCEFYAHNCDWRLDKLKKEAWKQLLKFDYSGWNNYFLYKTSTNIQIESIVQHCNEWVQQYDSWLVEKKEQEEQEEQKKKSKISVIGFSKVFKSKKKGTK